MKAVFVFALTAPWLLLAGYVFSKWREHRAWKREHDRKVCVFEFWKGQCEQALREGNREAFRVNLRRYKREVMGRCD